MKRGKIFIGTSGWSYKHWKGNFYPADIKDTDEFKYYQTQFSTVEINNSFYHLPLEKTFRRWREDTPPEFLFSVKASRYITHMKKLKTDEDSIDIFLERVKLLKEKLGPVLFQLPPGWKINLERLENFLKALPAKKKLRYTFELRNPTWYTEEVFALFRKYNCALCIFELEHYLTPFEITADFVYIRLHGPGNKYQGYYSKAQLQKWSERCKQWMSEGRDVYVYFDNDQSGYAAFNALTLKALISHKPLKNSKDSKDASTKVLKFFRQHL